MPEEAPGAIAPETKEEFKRRLDAQAAKIRGLETELVKAQNAAEKSARYAIAAEEAEKKLKEAQPEVAALKQQIADMGARYAADIAMVGGDEYRIAGKGAEAIRRVEFEEWKSEGGDTPFEEWFAQRVQDPPNYYTGYNAQTAPVEPTPVEGGEPAPAKEPAAFPGTKGTKETPPPAGVKALIDYTPEEWADPATRQAALEAHKVKGY